MARLFGLLLLIAGVLYPFAVYYGLEHWSPRVFAALLGDFGAEIIPCEPHQAARDAARTCRTFYFCGPDEAGAWAAMGQWPLLQAGIIP